MTTCPDTYPLWRTRRPVVLMASSSSASDGGGGGVLRHRYRYLATTPGAEAYERHLDSPGDDVDDVRGMLRATRISSGNLDISSSGYLTSDSSWDRRPAGDRASGWNPDD
jgi:hypothetical protein